MLDELAWSSPRRPTALIVDEPTPGLDEATKAGVHWCLDELAVGGVAILIVSSDVQEIVGMADRIVVLRAGKVVAELAHADADEASIMRAATGQTMGAAP